MHAKLNRAFTLIELLVVIAIIAILAAILFPVFAQAKVAAKKARVISDAKQIGLGQLMYTADSDDMFVTAVGGNSAIFDVWSVGVLPYIKNAGIFEDPFSPKQGPTNIWVANSRWAMPPRRAASRYCPSDVNDLSGCAMGVYNPNSLSQITGGQRWGRDGIAGSGRGTVGWPYMVTAYNASTPSLTTTAIARPADQLLVSQSGGLFDFSWTQDWNPDEAYRYFADDWPDPNLYGTSNVTCGPHARIGYSGPEGGVYPGTTYEPSVFPKGTNVSVYTDGHAKAQTWSAMHSQTVSNGTVRYLKYASPEIP